MLTRENTFCGFLYFRLKIVICFLTERHERKIKINLGWGKNSCFSCYTLLTCNISWVCSYSLSLLADLSLLWIENKALRHIKCWCWRTELFYGPFLCDSIRLNFNCMLLVPNVVKCEFRELHFPSIVFGGNSQESFL